MVKFDFRAAVGDDTAWTRDSDSGTWSRGVSWLQPFRHVALDFGLYRGSSFTTVVVREKVHGAGVLPARLHQDRAIASVVEQTRSWPGEFILMQLYPAALVVEAGRWGSAPVYLRADARGLRGSWDLGELRKPIGNGDQLDDEQAVDFLRGRQQYTSRTLFQEIEMLTERARATWIASAGLTIDYPQPAEHYRPRLLRDGAAVTEVFETLLHDAVGRRRPDGDVTIELSGGTDSAAVVLAGSGVFPRGRVGSYGMLVGGPAGRQQRYRRAVLADLAGTVVVTIDATSHIPLGPSHRTGLNPVEEPFSAALDAALAAAAQRGPSRSVLTGIGGDELVALRPDERAAQDLTVAPLYVGRGAPRVVEQAGARSSDAPVTSVAETALLAGLVRAPVFLRAGWWPIAPLCDPDLIRFFEWLPPRWRTEKRLPREWMRDRHRVPADVVVPRLRENFTDVMQTGVRLHGLDHLRSMLTTGSILFDRGYVDPDRLGHDVQILAQNPLAAVDVRLYDVIALDQAIERTPAAGQ